MRRRALSPSDAVPVVMVLAGLWAGILALAPVAGQDRTEPSPEPRYAGRESCARCHEEATEQWLGSHHDLAMQAATEDSVLGDFSQATHEHFGITSVFFRKEKDFVVRTEGPDGQLHDYRISYVFGVTPLQQYLVEFPGGRLQALSIAWDSRPVEDGGQRWFHLYPDERIGPGDELFWTGRNQNWNYMCAECHSTDLHKGYDPETDAYTTTWKEIDVSCEACHGPGSSHLTWAEEHEGDEEFQPDDPKGLVVDLRGSDHGTWVQNPETGTARRKVPLPSPIQVETCARCHSRRTPIWDSYRHGRPLLDTHRPALLEEGLYHPDGGILDEVYVYGSFLQSKMFQKGVVCSDCHEPHRLELRTTGNGLCYRCHHPTVFDTPQHHFHQADSPGASCVACHMPVRNYMVVDPRHDHGFRIPRPDLTLDYGVPNACQSCHMDRPPEWVTEAAARWYGPRPEERRRWLKAVVEGRRGRPEATSLLIELAGHEEAAGILRATALLLLGNFQSPAAGRAVRRALTDSDPLVRLGAVRGLEAAAGSVGVQEASRLLRDPVRAVRVEAARVLGPSLAAQGLSERGPDLERALQECLESELVNADRPGAQVNAGILLAELGRDEEAEQAYRRALHQEPRTLEAWVNLADLYRTRGWERQGEALLREALELLPDASALHHALGLLLVRVRRLPEALESLQRAAELGPENARFAYVYAVALHSVGEAEKAILTLEKAQRRHPDDRELLTALVTMSRERGDLETARRYARALVDRWPEDEAGRELLRSLEAVGR